MTAGKVYTIDLVSRDFDAYLRLEDSRLKELARGKDGGGVPSPHIVFQAPSTATYRIIVTCQGTRSGSYVLTIKQEAKAPPVGPSGSLPSDLKNLPVLQYRKGRPLLGGGAGDNSNTQFALLALWSAKKHGVPVKRSLEMAETRFRQSQRPDGSWAYDSGSSKWMDSMTCAGLLGLAAGHGSQWDADTAKTKVQEKSPAGKKAAFDPAIDRALDFVSRRIGKPGVPQASQSGRYAGGKIGANAHGDLYYLWSLERVAVVYGLKTIRGKDWHAWATPLLVASQQADGSWRDAHAGVPDTCFALLFLKRHNVARDLSDLLRSMPLLRERGEDTPREGGSTNDDKRNPDRRP
jgi:hypothetical protein